MKKLKYLLGFFVALVGLFINQTFAVSVEMVDIYGGSTYLADFPIYAGCRVNCDNHWGYMYYDISYNYGSVVNHIRPYYLNPDCGGTSDCESLTFNSSIFGYSPYQSTSYHNAAWSIHPQNFTYGGSFSQEFPQVVLGQGENHGQAFVCVDCFNFSLGINPAFGLGNNYLTGSNYKLVSNTTSNYFRFLYNDTGFNINNMNFVTLSGNVPLRGREYFNNTDVFTNYGRINDSQYTYKRFGLYGYGYSQVFAFDPTNTGSTSWFNLRLRTFSDLIEVPLSLMDANNQWILTLDDLGVYYYDGIIVVPENSYHLGVNNGQYLFAKDPTNTHRVLYEYYSCQNSNITAVFSGVNNCVKLDGGFLTYEGSTNVLPFDDSNTLYSLNSSPLLEDLTSGNRGYSSNDGNGFKLGSHYYGFQTSINVNLKNLYYGQGGLNTSVSFQINSGFLQKCLTNEDNFAIKYALFCNTYIIQYNQLNQQLGQAIQIPGSSGQYIQTSIDSGGNVTYWITTDEHLVEQMQGYEWVQSDDGSRHTIQTTGTNVSSENDILENSGYDYNQLSDYVKSYFENGFWFSCPFPYNQGPYKSLTLFGTKFFYQSIGRDFLQPIFCMTAGFKAGKNFTIFSGVNNPLSSRLLNSDNYSGLYNLFDIALSIGLLFFIIKIYHLLN